MPPDAATSLALDARAFELFADALDVPDAERTAFVDAACAGNAELNRRVRSLLDADEAATGFMDGRVPVPMELAAGQRIGAYRIVEPIGEGGMGMVYRAERADGAFDQDVAVKLLRVGLHSQEAAARFEHERRLLARLEHPHVVRLLDGGVVDDGALAGRPFLVMELVRGTPLTDHADRLRLGVDARLRLFLDVCDAVAHAHRRLIVHRDLKPSNVLVAEGDDGTAQVKLLDFGIAKALTTEHDAALTRTGTPLLTPAYAAPEQISGDAITTATDVYALGVVLYELLAGRRPYEVGTGSIAEVARAVLTAEPDRPSTAAGTPSKLSPEASALATGVAGRRGTDLSALRNELRGDLDAICLKALRKEPDRRYASAAELAADLRRHLAGDPVEAQRDTFGYRAGKFVRRHRAASAAALVAVLGLVLGAGLALWQAQQAQREAERAQAALAYLGGMFDRVDPAAAQDSSVIAGARALLSPALAGLHELDHQPLVKADVLGGLGRLTQSLGLFPTADSLHRAALALLPPDYDGAVRPELLLRLGLSLTEQRQYAQAESTLVQALGASGLHRDLEAAATVALGELLSRSGRPEHGKPYLRRALRYAHDPTIVTTASIGLADALVAEDSLASAEAILRESLLRLPAESPETDARQMLRPRVQALLATILIQDGRSGEAIRLLRPVLTSFRHVYGDDDYRVANTYARLGRALSEQGDLEEAARAYVEAIAIYERSSLGNNTLWQAQVMVRLGEIYLELDQHADAYAVLDAAASLLATDSGLGSFDYRIAKAERLLAEAAARTGQRERGRLLLLSGRERLGEAQAKIDQTAAEQGLSPWIQSYSVSVAAERDAIDAALRTY